MSHHVGCEYEPQQQVNSLRRFLPRASAAAHNARRKR